MRNILLASVALAAAPLALVGLSAPASAQSKLGIAVVSVDNAIGQSTAAQTATTQMQTTYKPQLDQLNARQTALQTELKQKEDALKAAATAAGQKPTPAQQTSLQQQYQALQARAQEAQAELNQLQQPLQLARAYVLEQINAKLDVALRAVMTKSKVDLLLKDGAAEAFQPSVDLTSALVTEINAVVPSVSITPPAGWRPGGQQQAGQPAAAGAAPAAPAAPAPIPPRPQGR
jgi:Skp family chaperone for outer membrane proteins